MQQQIVWDYDGDFSKHAPVRLLERMRLTWDSLPSQLARENKKFVYGLVRKGARAKDLEECIQWLRDYGVVQKVPRVTALRIPLSGYEDGSAFKLHALDVGLLGALAELPAHAVLEGSRMFTEFKGSLIEQYVMQEILLKGMAPRYWPAGNATAVARWLSGAGSAPGSNSLPQCAHTAAPACRSYRSDAPHDGQRTVWAFNVGWRPSARAPSGAAASVSSRSARFFNSLHLRIPRGFSPTLAFPAPR